MSAAVQPVACPCWRRPSYVARSRAGAQRFSRLRRPGRETFQSTSPTVRGCTRSPTGARVALRRRSCTTSTPGSSDTKRPWPACCRKLGMPAAIVTGSGGLIGSGSGAHFVQAGYDVIGLENDLRASFFGPDASTAHTTEALVKRFPHEFRSLEIDIRDTDAVNRVFAERAGNLEVVIHTAAQPSH